MATKKPVKTTAKSRSAKKQVPIEASPVATLLVVLFTALCVVFAYIAYINYGF